MMFASSTRTLGILLAGGTLASCLATSSDLSSLREQVNRDLKTTHDACQDASTKADAAATQAELEQGQERSRQLVQDLAGAHDVLSTRVSLLEKHQDLRLEYQCHVIEDLQKEMRDFIYSEAKQPVVNLRRDDGWSSEGRLILGSAADGRVVHAFIKVFGADRHSSDFIRGLSPDTLESHRIMIHFVLDLDCSDNSLMVARFIKTLAASTGMEAVRSLRTYFELTSVPARRQFLNELHSGATSDFDELAAYLGTLAEDSVAGGALENMTSGRLVFLERPGVEDLVHLARSECGLQGCS